MERDIRIDILKGIGIILVVWGHATAILIKEICIFHMPLFFFLAGMCYHPKQGFIQSRAKRLLIPFGEYSLIFAVFYFSMGLQGIPLDKLSIHHIAAFDGPLWFLVALFYICVIYYFLDKTVKEKNVILIVSFVIGLAVAYSKINLPFYIGQGLFSLPFYAVGKWMNDKGLTQAEGAIKKATVIAIAGYIIAIAFCRLAHYQFDISQLKFSSFPFIFYAGAFCAIYLLLNFKPFNKITTTNRILASLGANSLTIMAIHAPFLWLFRDFIRTNSSFYNTKLGGGNFKLNHFCYLHNIELFNCPWNRTIKKTDS